MIGPCFRPSDLMYTCPARRHERDHDEHEIERARRNAVVPRAWRRAGAALALRGCPATSLPVASSSPRERQSVNRRIDAGGTGLNAATASTSTARRFETGRVPCKSVRIHVPSLFVVIFDGLRVCLGRKAVAVKSSERDGVRYGSTASCCVQRALSCKGSPSLCGAQLCSHQAEHKRNTADDFLE